MPTKHHDLKIRPKDYRDIESNGKRFEVRFNDRNFEVGDILNLCEWAGGGGRIYWKKNYLRSQIYPGQSRLLQGRLCHHTN